MLKSFWCSLIIMTATVASAEPNPIEQRQHILKGFGDATKPVVAMLKGETPFDKAKVDAALKTYIAGVHDLPALFPDDSKTGFKTEALPSIWENKSKFEAIYVKLGTDAQNAMDISDLGSLRAQFPKVLGNCKACHDDFRKKD